jgi:riboflavin kinase/FMN adenylyltransferase
VEAWLLDFEGDLYGQTVTVEFYKFLRPEQKYPNLAALQAQIALDAAQARAFFREREK